MNRQQQFSRTLAAITLLALAQACTTTSTSPIDEASLNEGLERVPSKTVDALYRRPGATLASYTKLLMRPIDVQFAKNWDPSKTSSALYQMHEPDREKIKTEMATLFADVFKADMTEKGGFPIVTASGPDVLEMRAAIVNLYITAPDVSMDVAGRSKVYTTEAGEMTLIMQLHDSVTGQLLARVYDRRAATGSGWQWTNSVTNTAEARRVIGTWATALRKAFDAAHAPAASST
jgi:Protein of unknown function (DUF3313)